MTGLQALWIAFVSAEAAGDVPAANALYALRTDPRAVERLIGMGRYGSAQLPIMGEHGDEIYAMASRVRPRDLAPKGVEDDPHVTALYGLHDECAAEVGNVVKGFASIAVQLGKVKVFEATPTQPHDVLYIEVESSDIEALHRALCELPHTRTQEEYRPHVTLAYLKPGRGQYYADQFGSYDAALSIGVMIYSDPDKQKTAYQFAVPEAFADWKPGVGAKGQQGWVSSGGQFRLKKPASADKPVAPTKEEKAATKKDSTTEVAKALTDPGKADLKALAGHLNNLTGKQLEVAKKAIGVKGGALKGDKIKRILEHVKSKAQEIKTALEAKKKQPVAKPAPVKAAPKKAEPKKEEKSAPVKAEKANVEAVKTELESLIKTAATTGVKGEFGALVDKMVSLSKPDVKELAKSVGVFLPANFTKSGALPKIIGTLSAKIGSAALTAPADSKIAGGKPSQHFDYITGKGEESGLPRASESFKKDHPYADKDVLKDAGVTGRPNPAVPDAARPPIKDKAVAKAINNYTWGYNGDMNAALRNTGASPPGEFGGSNKEGESKPAINGPKMFAALQKAFADAKPFGPPPIPVYRGLALYSPPKLKEFADAAEAAYKSGGVLTMPGFTSTTTDKERAFDGNVQIKINAIHGLDTQPYSHFAFERELLLNHNAEYRVKSIKRSAYGLELELDQVSTGVKEKK